nr:hypothetical protein [Kibdelosporangium sp. MJ126-NF4]CTQ98364.1 hypothetical protein [Kibdelosporangium sp. MJ126-NF4]
MRMTVQAFPAVCPRPDRCSHSAARRPFVSFVDIGGVPAFRPGGAIREFR